MVIKTSSYFSVFSLIIANTIPLIGVLFFEWSLFQIMFLYWLESAVVGFYNIFRMIKVSGLLSIILAPFFIFHYGAFMTGHLVFIFAFFVPENITASLFPSSKIMINLLGNVLIPLIALFVSHGISFFYNFIGKREYERTNIKKQMHAPYKRIVLMHITIIFGGWLMLLLKAPIFGLIMLIILKTIADIRAHIKEHTRLQKLV